MALPMLAHGLNSCPLPTFSQGSIQFMRILGLVSHSHDSGIALLDEGKIELVYEEERFNREKHTVEFPHQSLADAINQNCFHLQNIDYITVPWNINELRRTIRGLVLKRFPLSLSLLLPGNHGPQRYSIVFQRLRIWHQMKRLFPGVKVPPIVEVCHHDAHAASFFVSPYDDATVLIMDGYGDMCSTSVYTGQDNRLTQHWKNSFVDSVGMLYSLVTRYLGFAVFGDEGKVMGLAAYGDDTYVDAFKDLIHLKENGQYSINMDYFSHSYLGEKWPFKRKFYETFGELFAQVEPVTQRQKDIAFALQAVVERTIIHVVRGLEKQYDSRKLVFAGGVAMNCVANAKLLNETDFEEIWVPPGASDTGVPIGSALWHYHQTLGHDRTFEQTHAFYGRSYSDSDIEKALNEFGLKYDHLNEKTVIERAAKDLSEGNIIGWFQGRFEMGPRALGNRSILADPRRAEMKDTINARIKHREGFRPFAPAVLIEESSNYFEIDQADPFMTIAPRIRPDKVDQIPAVVHADGTGRFQTVERSANSRYYDLIKAFQKITGVPVLLNTSFNKQEPIVTTPAEAISCFLRTDMDALALGDYYVTDRNPAAITRAHELKK